jgi:hypothetical protein
VVGGDNPFNKKIISIKYKIKNKRLDIAPVYLWLFSTEKSQKKNLQSALKMI